MIEIVFKFIHDFLLKEGITLVNHMNTEYILSSMFIVNQSVVKRPQTIMGSLPFLYDTVFNRQKTYHILSIASISIIVYNLA